MGRRIILRQLPNLLSDRANTIQCIFKINLDLLQP